MKNVYYDWMLFHKLKMSGPLCWISLDEVGRGCIAGSVVVGASLWVNFTPKEYRPFYVFEKDLGVGDSKKLSPKKREKCSLRILESLGYGSLPPVCGPLEHPLSMAHLEASSVHQKYAGEEFLEGAPSLKLQQEGASMDLVCLGVCLGMASAQEVDSFNVWGGVQLAANRALFGLRQGAAFDTVYRQLPLPLILMDGKLPVKLESFWAQCPQVVVTGGDALFASVGVSSIVAKVWRDAQMVALDKVYPGYDFASHKGYGTKKHFDYLREKGLSLEHRKSFIHL